MAPPDAPPSRSDADELLADDDDDFDDETCIEAFVFTLQEVVYSRWFNNAVLFVILANSVCMALEDPVIEDKWSEPGQAALAYLDFVFCSQESRFSGTLVRFTSSIEMWNTVSSRPTRFNTLVERLIERIGYIYSTIINDNRATIRISSFPLSGDGMSHNPIPAVMPFWVESYSPEPGSVDADLGNGTIQLEYHFGKIRQSETHNECYRANVQQQGAEIRLNGRLIADKLFKIQIGVF